MQINHIKMNEYFHDFYKFTKKVKTLNGKQIEFAGKCTGTINIRCSILGEENFRHILK